MHESNEERSRSTKNRTEQKKDNNNGGKNEASSLRKELEENKKVTEHLKRETKRKSEMVESITTENRILRNEWKTKTKIERQRK